jgi:SPP1 family predicted phage head-tail adaptor
MTTRSGAGQLDKRVTFLKPVNADDGHGGTVENWEPQFDEPARLIPKIGSEEVVAQRLQGKQPYVLRVRSSTRTRDITTDWRVTNARTGVAYAIKSSANLDERCAYIDFLVVEGDDD